MIATNLLKANLIYTFQFMIASAVLAPETAKVYAPDGSKVTVLPPTLPGLAVEFSGTGLTGPDSGMIENFAIISTANGSRLDGLLPLLIALLDLTEAVSAGSGEVNATNFALFFLLMMPHPFYQLLYEGSNRRETVEGFQGNDEFRLKGGDDTLIMGPGEDKANGGAGNDKIDASLLDSGVRADLDRGTVRVNDTGAINKLRLFEEVDGTEFNDVIKGDENANTLKGFDGNDNLSGKDGDDRLEGGRHRDTLDGGEGDDFLLGGQGRDTFIMNPSADGVPDDDTIDDFEDNYDRLDLTGFGFETVAEALSHARNTSLGVIFEMPNGDIIRVNGDINKARIADDIDI